MGKNEDVRQFAAKVVGVVGEWEPVSLEELAKQGYNRGEDRDVRQFVAKVGVVGEWEPVSFEGLGKPRYNKEEDGEVRSWRC